MCEQSRDDLTFYIYDKGKESAEDASRDDARKKAPLKNRREKGSEILMFKSGP